MTRIVFFETPDESAGIPGGKIGAFDFEPWVLDPDGRNEARTLLESALSDIHGGEIHGEFETEDPDNKLEYGPWGVPL